MAFTLSISDNPSPPGASSGEVIVVLFISWKTPLESGFDDQDGGAGGGARFQGFVGVSVLSRTHFITDRYAAHGPTSCL